MTTAVDLCNVALGYLGDKATVSSLDPPEGSTQADHCARFYPIARDTLLDSHPWGFATTETSLGRLSATSSRWLYTYAAPSDMLRLLGITDNSLYRLATEEFERATNESGKEVILCNAGSPIARYTYRVTDTTLFPPLFSQALAWHLASLLAGPITKGISGAQQAQRCAMLAENYLERAKAADAMQTKRSLPFESPWLKARRGDGDYSKF